MATAKPKAKAPSKPAKVKKTATTSSRATSQKARPVKTTPAAAGGERSRALVLRRWLAAYWPLVLIVGCIVGLAVATITLGIKYHQLNQKYHQSQTKIAQLSDPQAAAQQEVKSLVSEVSQLVSLPDETPTLATVTDPSKLQDQQFFTEAQKGDKVLIFPNAKRAVLYRPSTHKVIESAPVQLNGDAAAAGATGAASGLGN
ncbi:MAG: hypothetical protein WDN27_03815 [Candidatus Saccharibacteria bacterium]